MTKSKWVHVDDGNGPSGTMVPLDWQWRCAVAMIGGGLIGFVFAAIIFH